MKTTIKQWIENLFKVHRECIRSECPSLTVEEVFHCYMANSDDEYVNVYDAFKIAGYDIER